MSKMGEVNNTLTQPVNVNLEELSARFKRLKGINPGVTHTRQAGKVLNNPNVETFNMVPGPQVVESVHDANDLPCGESDNSVRDSHMESLYPLLNLVHLSLQVRLLLVVMMIVHMFLLQVMWSYHFYTGLQVNKCSLNHLVLLQMELL